MKPPRVYFCITCQQRRCSKPRQTCDVCLSRILPGMDAAVEAQASSAAQVSGEELTAKLLEPKADISKTAGKIERDSPLFYGTGDNPLLF